jgi:excisionase family DNA binding protein
MERLLARAGSAEIPDVDAIRGARMLLTVEQAACLLGVGRTTMFALIRSGDVVTVQIGRLRRVRPADLASYVDRLANVA